MLERQLWHTLIHFVRLSLEDLRLEASWLEQHTTFFVRWMQHMVWCGFLTQPRLGYRVCSDTQTHFVTPFTVAPLTSFATFLLYRCNLSRNRRRMAVKSRRGR